MKAPSLPAFLRLQVLCYERADDIGFGVSGVVTKARALRASIPDLETAGIPMATPVTEEKVLYLLDPVGASRRSALLRLADDVISSFKWALPVEHDALALPWTPGFLHKSGGMVLSMGQFMQWVGAKVQSTGTVQIWPGTPVGEALVEGQARGFDLSIKLSTKMARPARVSLPAWTSGLRSPWLPTARSAP